MNKRFGIELDCTGFDDCFGAKEQLKRFKSVARQYKIKCTGLVEYCNCYNVGFEGTMENLKKFILDVWNPEEEAYNELVADGCFTEV